MFNVLSRNVPGFVLMLFLAACNSVEPDLLVFGKGGPSFEQALKCYLLSDFIEGKVSSLDGNLSKDGLKYINRNFKPELVRKNSYTYMRDFHEQVELTRRQGFGDFAGEVREFEVVFNDEKEKLNASYFYKKTTVEDKTKIMMDDSKLCGRYFSREQW